MKMAFSRPIKFTRASIFFVPAIVVACLTITYVLSTILRLESFIYFLCLAVGGSFLLSVWSWKMFTGRLFDPYILFLVAAVLFNAGHAILEIFGLNENGILDGRFTEETIALTLMLVTVGIVSLHFGALIGVRRLNQFTAKGEAITDVQLYNLRVVGWILILVSIVPSILLLREAVSVVMSFGYGALYQRNLPTGFQAAPQVIASFLVPGSVFLLAGSKNHFLGKMCSAILVLAYSVIQLFLGHRGWAVMPLIAYAWLWHSYIRAFRKKTLFLAAAIMLIVVFPLVKAVRGLPGTERLDLRSLVVSYASIENPIIDIISEMGGSMRTVAYTLELVPISRQFDRGLEYLYAFSTVIPNFAWKVHPAIGFELPGKWLIWAINPYIALLGGGMGYSFVAEAFLNFGWAGTPLVMLLLGFCLARLVVWGTRPDKPARLAALASFTAFFLMYARGESIFLFRPLVWYSLFPYLMVFIVANLNARLFLGETKSPKSVKQTLSTL